MGGSVKVAPWAGRTGLGYRSRLAGCVRHPLAILFVGSFGVAPMIRALGMMDSVWGIPGLVWLLVRFLLRGGFLALAVWTRGPAEKLLRERFVRGVRLWRGGRSRRWHFP